MDMTGEDTHMKILVDADACPVVPIVEHMAEKYGIPVILLCDTNHRSEDTRLNSSHP